jgi:hypothetical protein
MVGNLYPSTVVQRNTVFPYLSLNPTRKLSEQLRAAVDAAIEEGIAKFGGKKPNKAAIKLPLRDGDIRA